VYNTITSNEDRDRILASPGIKYKILVYFHYEQSFFCKIESKPFVLSRNSTFQNLKQIIYKNKQIFFGKMECLFLDGTLFFKTS
jgi:hypothetical protein